MTPDEFRRAGHALVEWIAAYRERLARADLPVQATVQPGEVIARLPAAAPERGEPFEAILADVEALLMPGVTHWQHPRFFGYFPSGGSLASVLGDMLSTGLGVIGLNWQAGPALTELEQVTTDWMRDLLGLPPSFSGVIQDTASAATFVALVCARERASNYCAAHAGLQGGDPPLVVYTSAQAHSSVEKAALLAGFGRDHVRAVPLDGEFRLDVMALEAAIAADRAAGRRPCAVVATSGTTATTAMDPIAAIAAVARREQLWLHVDAAMGGSAMMLPEFRHHWDGIEAADSVVVNPHKWLTVAFDCSLYFVRDAEHLVRVMSTNPSYLQTPMDARVRNYRDWGVPLGRRFRALKLWLTLRDQGAEALRARLRRDLDNAQWLAAQVRAEPAWEVTAPVVLQTVCVRHAPRGMSAAQVDEHTRRWTQALNDSGTAYLTPALVGGRWVTRVSIGIELTERTHVAQLWDAMRRVASTALAAAAGGDRV
ncbi:MAG: aminotransferase class V-fold PLP-dependent enzyme [Proteobacteria bacterium]|nr:aminotransferase class V-fold PLP-dependent enzyme [Pseudomonadota bacterium]